MSNNDKLFSERMGLTTPKAMQVDDLDKDARTALYNVAYRLLHITPLYLRGQNNDRIVTWMPSIGITFLKMAADVTNEETIRKKCKELILSDQWYRVFDLLEFIYDAHNKFMRIHQQHNDTGSNFSQHINDALKQENIGYRLVAGKFTPITNEEEIKEIEQALLSPYEYAGNHIKKAISLFANRQNPDYANIIKESISAVESLAKEITGEKSFDKAIEKLKENGVKLHPQFEQAIKKMYQFTSDDDGIRHGGTKEPLQCDQATARYMLIICSAFVNFITDKTADKKP